MRLPPTIRPTVADADIVREDLPLPVVHYPAAYGVFIGFASDHRARPLLCECARPAVEQLFALHPALKVGTASMGLLSTYFPRAIALRLAGADQSHPLTLDYLPGLCHRCNAATPLLRYCGPREGSEFLQRFGWYVNQAYLRFGMLPHDEVHLAHQCAPEYLHEEETARATQLALESECTRLLEMIYDNPQRPGQPAAQPPMIGPDHLARMLKLREEASSARKQLNARLEAMARQEIGAWALKDRR